MFEAMPAPCQTWCGHTPLECIGVISPSSSQALDTTFDRLKWNEQNRFMSDLSFRKERLLETETHVFPCCFSNMCIIACFIVSVSTALGYYLFYPKTYSGYQSLYSCRALCDNIAFKSPSSYLVIDSLSNMSS